MPKSAENKISRHGGAVRYKTIEKDGKQFTCAITHEPVTEAANLLVDKLLEVAVSDNHFPGHYEVVVADSTLVYSGRDADRANEAYSKYVALSKGDSGRIAGAPVTMLCNGKNVQNYAGVASPAGAN